MKRFMISVLIIVSLIIGSLSNVYSQSLRYEVGELVLKMNQGQDISPVLNKYGLLVNRHLVKLDVYLVNTVSVTDLDSLSAVIEEESTVDFCHPNFRIVPLQAVQSSLPVSDREGGEGFRSQNAVQQLDLDTAHTIATGSEIKIAILDGGINYNHPILAPVALNGSDWVDDDNDPFDEPGGDNSGHGTFVAGVIQLTAPDASIQAYRVTDVDGNSNGYIVADAILQAVDDGCRIINLSLVTIEVHQAISDAINYAVNNDVLIVAAAGNGYNESEHFPASDPKVLSVAAIDTLNVLADFSSYGIHVDVCAPGTSINAPFLDSSFAFWGGTSFASPFVAAQAALLWATQPNATCDEIVSAILSTAVNIDQFNNGLEGKLGAGMIDPFASLLYFDSSIGTQFVQDTNDLHHADSLDLLVSGYLDVNSGEFKVEAKLYIFNDANVYMGGTSGFSWDKPNLRLDSVKFSNSFLNEVSGFRALLSPTDSLRLANINQNFAFNFVDYNLNGILPDPSEKRLQGSYYFTLSDWNYGDMITFDTVTISESMKFQFVSASNPGHAYPLYWSGPKKIEIKVSSVGNVNNDSNNEIDIADLTMLIDHLFINQIPLPNISSANMDCNSGVDIGDVTALINFLFRTIDFPQCP